MVVSKNRQHEIGFTLVEVIVVAVIIAVLAAIAIPVYNGFVRDARQDAVDGLAQSAAAAANVWLRKTGANPALSDLDLFYDDDKFDVTVSAADSSITVTMDNHASVTKKVFYRPN